MRRHVKFNSINDVKTYLQQNTPAHCYHSVAYYEDPGKMSMVEKEWKGADLIFDLDADHLPEMEEVKKRFRVLLVNHKKHPRNFFYFFFISTTTTFA